MRKGFSELLLRNPSPEKAAYFLRVFFPHGDIQIGRHRLVCFYMKHGRVAPIINPEREEVGVLIPRPLNHETIFPEFTADVRGLPERGEKNRHGSDDDEATKKNVPQNYGRLADGIARPGSLGSSPS